MADYADWHDFVPRVDGKSHCQDELTLWDWEGTEVRRMFSFTSYML